MNYSAPASVQTRDESSEAHAHGHASFSRASHYAMALVPMILAVATILVRDFLGQPAWQRVSVFAAFVFSISAVLFILRALDQVQDKNL